MPKKNLIGAWAFLIGVILAVVLGLFINLSNDSSPILKIVLLILGIVIGLLNVTSNELKDFMLAGTVLVIVSALGGNILSTITFVGDIVTALIILFVPATIVVSLKQLFALGKR